MKSFSVEETTQTRERLHYLDWLTSTGRVGSVLCSLNQHFRYTLLAYQGWRTKLRFNCNGRLRHTMGNVTVLFPGWSERLVCAQIQNIPVNL